MRNWVSNRNITLVVGILAGYYVGRRYDVKVLVKKESGNG